MTTLVQGALDTLRDGYRIDEYLNAFAEDGDESALRGAWAEAEAAFVPARPKASKRRGYRRAPDNLQWRKLADYPVEVSPYGTARWTTDGKGHKAGDWLELKPNGYGDVFYRLWDSLRQKQVYFSPGRILTAAGWLPEPKYRRKRPD